ncbi:hypothetical protein BU26DRAFT_517844 [Trematosphaeria pertusa]|uniref:Uncharacterized protein n=1 Tax=Trematosphaeria pertusa TaxID=390896 RepID=A0A6A6ILL6_9PLEO|nr:uncharacterized protein BU26DRAFT_517844 [Trematosphaeria pertusa]KAF2251117.1 hypothetical protein BU26DRAFT_517844 [Trematosphaeria pertusa]
MASLHQLALPPVINGMRNTIAFLTKAQTHIQTTGIDPSTLTTASLHPTMREFTAQIHWLIDAAKAMPSRINPSLPPFSLPDVETDIPSLIAKLEKTIAYLEGIKPEDLNGRENDEVLFVIRPPGREEIRLRWDTAVVYVQQFAHANFWFHVTTAYDILRHKGVELGKADFLQSARFLQ